jgi:hypothetical protein
MSGRLFSHEAPRSVDKDREEIRAPGRATPALILDQDHETARHRARRSVAAVNQPHIARVNEIATVDS